MRPLKEHWKGSLTLLFLLFAVAIGGGFYLVHLDLVPTAVPTTLVAVMTPTVYYIYKEVLDRPLVSIEKKDQALSVAPMFASVDQEKLQETEEVEVSSQSVTEEIKLLSQVVRPAVFYRLSIENEGKATAQNAMVHIRLVPEDTKHEFEYYARWMDPGNSDRYDLLPGQSREVQILKIFLSNDFFPVMDITEDEDVPRDTGVGSINPPGNPSGLIRCFSDIEPEDIQIHPFIPREKRPERGETSVHGGWEGRNMATHLESITGEFSIEARVVADNYKIGWKQEIDTIAVLDIVESVENDEIWQDQWGRLGDHKEEIQQAVSDWISDSQ